MAGFLFYHRRLKYNIMVKKMTDVPDYVAGFEASGKIDKNDYDNIVLPELERVDKAHGHLHYIMVLKTPLKNFSLGAWMQDAWAGIKHFRGWKRIAIVSDEKTIENITDKFEWAVPGQSKGFKLSEIEKAKKWVAEEE